MSIDYRNLRARLRIEDVLRWMSWEPGSSCGVQLRGRCPFCSEVPSRSVHRSFSVNTERNIYRCFRCQQSGNAIDLWSNYRQLSLYQAAQELEARLSPNTQPPN